MQVLNLWETNRINRKRSGKGTLNWKLFFFLSTTNNEELFFEQNMPRHLSSEVIFEFIRIDKSKWFGNVFLLCIHGLQIQLWINSSYFSCEYLSITAYTDYIRLYKKCRESLEGPWKNIIRAIEVKACLLWYDVKALEAPPLSSGNKSCQQINLHNSGYDRPGYRLHCPNTKAWLPN